MKRGHLALYGNIGIPRRYCDRCKRWAFVLDGIRQCCNHSTKEDLGPVRKRRMSQPVDQRKRPSLAQRTRILEEQRHGCRYCRQRFGAYFIRGTKLIRICLVWDHVDPFVYSQNNHSENCVAACQVCNGWKSDQLFSRWEELTAFLNTQWEKKIWRKYGKSPENFVEPVEIPLSSNDSINSSAVQNADGANGIPNTHESKVLSDPLTTNTPQ